MRPAGNYVGHRRAHRRIPCLHVSRLWNSLIEWLLRKRELLPSGLRPCFVAPAIALAASPSFELHTNHKSRTSQHCRRPTPLTYFSPVRCGMSCNKETAIRQESRGAPESLFAPQPPQRHHRPSVGPLSALTYCPEISCSLASSKRSWGRRGSARSTRNHARLLQQSTTTAVKNSWCVESGDGGPRSSHWPLSRRSMNSAACRRTLRALILVRSLLGNTDKGTVPRVATMHVPTRTGTHWLEIYRIDVSCGGQRVVGGGCATASAPPAIHREPLCLWGQQLVVFTFGRCAGWRSQEMQESRKINWGNGQGSGRWGCC